MSRHVRREAAVGGDRMLFLQPKPHRPSESARYFLVPSRSIHAKLSIALPGHACEHEADRVSKQAMSMPDSHKIAESVNAVGADAGEMEALPVVHEVVDSPRTRAFTEPRRLRAVSPRLLRMPRKLSTQRSSKPGAGTATGWPPCRRQSVATSGVTVAVV
jgi:hypothetical protein